MNTVAKNNNPFLWLIFIMLTVLVVLAAYLAFAIYVSGKELSNMHVSSSLYSGHPGEESSPTLDASSLFMSNCTRGFEDESAKSNTPLNKKVELAYCGCMNQEFKKGTFTLQDLAIAGQSPDDKVSVTPAINKAMSNCILVSYNN